MKSGLKKVVQKIGDALCLAVSTSGSNQDPLTKAKQYALHQINQDKYNHTD
jgi:hypothetical protein